jgi:hypothetical protein
LLLFVATSSMSACIIPVGPEFQDPPATVDAPPYVLSSTPQVATPVTVAPNGEVDFVVTVVDPEVGATIYYQWALDYPPNVPGTTLSGGPPDEILPLGDGKPTQGALKTFPLRCTTFLASPTSGSNHVLALILADRQLSQTRFGQIDDHTGVVAPTTIWPVNMPCQASPVVTP